MAWKQGLAPADRWVCKNLDFVLQPALAKAHTGALPIRAGGYLLQRRGACQQHI